MNEYYNPLRESFKLAKKLDKITFWFMIVSAALTIFNYIFNIYLQDYKSIAVILSTINTIIITIYALLKFAISYIIFHTSFDKRSDFIDNSFGTNYSSNRSNQYYNNDTIENGILRMGANSFESCFFTYNLSVKSLQSKWIINIAVTVIIIGLALQGYNSALSMILQLALPLYLISDAVNNSIFCLRIKNILDNFCRLYNDLLDSSQLQKKEPEIILIVLNYETTLSTFNLLISEEVYNKYNPDLSVRWTGLKEQYNLK
ncbi:hypothetical protein FMM05_18255 [Flavobacterium zepuense]|uniref:Uncharacterized protein n=1 Tax=Flavobacterium zepuense TaxID=2593302 RepID=A0A552UV74_9FLAO|nr:hypothetical protein [Flavobacterium zepuense]TRW22131.1 hypothetical protein FMM05_18255 [Flavobacterium zepuense]